ncbi:MAG: ROK family glucokinase [Lachnospiraceae bacterium]
MEKIVFGVDVGGTTVKIGLFTESGTLLKKWEIPTRTEDSGKYILPDIADSVLGAMEADGYTKKDVIGVGIGTPGPVDGMGYVHKAVNLGWDYFNLEDTFHNLVDLPVRAGNDANVAALGEMWKGGGQGFQDIVAVTLGTGVGGGIIVREHLVAGANGAAGEFGHMHIEDAETLACNCGGKGCLEQYASATGIVRLATRRLSKDEMPSMLRGKDFTAKDVWDAVKAGDQVAIDVAESFGYYLGKGLSMVASVTNPEAFVIGGGVSKAGEIIFQYTKPYYEQYTFSSTRDVKFLLAQLGNDAGIYGAARMVLS